MILLFLLCTICALAAPTRLPADLVDTQRATDLFRGRRLALLVGPAAFSSPDVADLAYTDDDALALAAVLEDPARGAFDHVWTLTEPTVSGLSGVRRAMAQLEAASTGPDDTVFVYFSTHGSLWAADDGTLRQYLVLADTRLPELPETGLAQQEVLDWLDRLPSRRKVLIFATCHSGQGKSALPPTVARLQAHTKGPLPVPPLRDVSEAVVLIGVCAWDETARESAELGHDIYTWYFLQALENGDLNGDGAVTVTEAHDQARRGTWTFTGGAQRPYARAEILGEDPIVLTGRQGTATKGILGSWRERWEGYRVAVDGQVKGTLPNLIPVGPGTHRVALMAPVRDRVVAAATVNMREGESLELDRLVRRDQVRVGVGSGWLLSSAPGTDGPTLGGELQFPSLLGHGWEIVLSGSTRARWPRPSLQGAVLVEHALSRGVIQPRLGGGLAGFLLNSADGSLLAPSLVPTPSASLVWLPHQFPATLRLGVLGGYLWFTDRGAWHQGFMLSPSLVVGMGW
ncbi:MAG: caspase family protein [Oligoflexia bacterium]|nr:caspase family protein [Oligoflexia bacterium]